MNKLLTLIIATFLFIGCNSGEKKTEETKSTGPEIITTVLNVEGMTCSGCENTVTTAVGELAGVSKVKASHEAKFVKVKHDKNSITIEEITKTIEEKGYSVKGELKDKSVEAKHGEVQN